MRAVIYARYSSDLQRDASIEDQVRVCRRRIEAEGWSLRARLFGSRRKRRLAPEGGLPGAAAGREESNSSTSSWRKASTACRAIRSTWRGSTSSSRSTACF